MGHVAFFTKIFAGGCIGMFSEIRLSRIGKVVSCPYFLFGKKVTLRENKLMIKS